MTDKQPNDSEGEHDYFFHGIFTDCGACGHPARCVRLQENATDKKVDVCRLCIGNESGVTLELWCSDCEQTIPSELRG